MFDLPWKCHEILVKTAELCIHFKSFEGKYSRKVKKCFLVWKIFCSFLTKVFLFTRLIFNYSLFVREHSMKKHLKITELRSKSNKTRKVNNLDIVEVEYFTIPSTLLMIVQIKFYIRVIQDSRFFCVQHLFLSIFQFSVSE